jgi:hypothetical protein
MSTININGVGFAATVEVAEGESLSEALERAGLADVESLDVAVDGAEIDFDESPTVSGGEQVTATPKAAALG